MSAGWKKLLFICSRNQWRSPTAEKLMQGFNGYEARSAGTAEGARIRVTAGHIGWADVIFVMEKKHGRKIREQFGDAIGGKEIICLHIPDDYRFMDSELIELLKARLEDHVSVPD